MRILAILLLLCGVFPTSGVEVTNVFVSGTGGYHTYRIPAMVVSKQGTVLAFCEGRKTGRGDAGAIDLLLKRSIDQGRSWTEQQIVWADGGNTCGNPTPVVDTTGKIWLMMTWNLGSDHESQIVQRKSRDTRRVFVTSSTDDGKNWTKPVEITATTKKPEWDWYATGPGNGIQLTRGAFKDRIVIPANHSELNREQKPILRSHVIFSDDHGTTWQLGGVEEEKTNESTIIERADGSLLHNMRSYHQQNRRAIASSADGGAKWSPVTLDPALIEPVCQASMVRWTWPAEGEKSRILFCNPASLKRDQLTLRMSLDDGKTWIKNEVIHAGPAAYSSLAILPDKSVLCLYECGKTNAYERISLARIERGWGE